MRNSAPGSRRRREKVAAFSRWPGYLENTPFLEIELLVGPTEDMELLNRSAYVDSRFWATAGTCDQERIENQEHLNATQWYFVGYDLSRHWPAY